MNINAHEDANVVVEAMENKDVVTDVPSSRVVAHKAADRETTLGESVAATSL